MRLISWVVKRWGALAGALLITLVSAVLSMVATGLVMRLTSGSVGRDGLIYGMVIPLIIAPPFSYITLRLVQQLHETQSELERLSCTDPLTGAGNRRLFMECAAREMARSRRHGGFGVVSLDVDNLKEINDRLGHAAGDALLVSVAETCQGLCRDSDIFARMGGDEFGFVLSDIDQAGMSSFAHRLLVAMRDITCTYGAETLATTVSIGTALYMITDADLSELLRRADNAMYVVKHAGGDAAQHG